MLSLDLGGMENFTVAILSTTPMFMVLIAGTPGTLFRAAVALGVVYGFTFTFGPPYAVDGVDSLARMKIAVVLGATLLCAFCVALAFIQYMFDSKALAGAELRTSFLGRNNGIAYFVMVGIPVIREALQLSWPPLGWITALAWLLVLSTAASLLDPAITLIRQR